MCGKAGSWVGPAAYLLACAALAVLLEPYDLYRFTHAGTFAIAIVGLNLLAGQCGQLSIGHGAFFAAGAYAVAIATSGSGVPVPAALAAAVALGFALGCGLGWPASRLGNVHLTLVTWGLALVVPQVLKSSHVERWTGGTQGIYLDRSPPPSWFPAGEDHWWFGVTALGLLGVLTMARRLIRGRRGRTRRALRDHELASRALGIDVTWERTIAFGVSAACAALGGGIAALLSDSSPPTGTPCSSASCCSSARFSAASIRRGERSPAACSCSSRQISRAMHPPRSRFRCSASCSWPRCGCSRAGWPVR